MYCIFWILNVKTRCFYSKVFSLVTWVQTATWLVHEEIHPWHDHFKLSILQLEILIVNVFLVWWCFRWGGRLWGRSNGGRRATWRRWQRCWEGAWPVKSRIHQMTFFFFLICAPVFRRVMMRRWGTCSWLGKCWKSPKSFTKGNGNAVMVVRIWVWLLSYSFYAIFLLCKSGKTRRKSNWWQPKLTWNWEKFLLNQVHISSVFIMTFLVGL